MKTNKKNALLTPKIRTSKISIKVLFPVFALVIIGILIAIIGNRNMENVYTSSKQITDVYMNRTDELNQISNQFTELESLAYQMYITKMTNERANMLESAEEYLVLISDNMATFKEKISGTDTEQYFTDIEAQYQKYTKSCQSYMEYIEADNKIKAQMICSQDLIKLGSNMQASIDAYIAVLDDAVSKAEQEQQRVYEQSRTINSAMFVALLFILILAIYISIFKVVRPLKKTSIELDTIVKGIQSNNGDLTQRMSVSSGDEIGQLASGINIFLDTLQHILGQILSDSNTMEGIVNHVVNSVSETNDSANGISAEMEELSATMEQVSSSITLVNKNIIRVNESVIIIADATKDLNYYVNEMQNRAEELKQNAVQNKTETHHIVNSILESLESAINESSSVEQINKLTNEILSVSSQTNLLALNASIEAARAGEAGKGFAVVAEEIRNLADSTKNTANNIQSINTQVISAVHKLADNAHNLVQYINQTIMPDYESFVNTGEQYCTDAEYVNNTMKLFEERANELSAFVSQITASTSDIASAVNESAKSVSDTTQNAYSLVKNMDSVHTHMDENRNISQHLRHEADRFKKV